MTDDIDRVLSSEPEIQPSRAFVASVMNAVERESAAPPPIPFPWLRALPMAAVALALAVVVVTLAPVFSAAPSSVPSPAVDGFVRAASTPAAVWTAVGLLVSAASAFAVTIRARS